MIPINPDEPTCPFCGESRAIEKIGRIWFCVVCANEFEFPTPGAEEAGTRRSENFRRAALYRVPHQTRQRMSSRTTPIP
jgi:ribosomal protein L37AE/L43A